MWRKWNNQHGNKGLYIGQPTLIETTVEEGYLETIPEVDSIRSTRSSGSTALPELPFRAMTQVPEIQYHQEPAWSQPSPTIPDYYAPQDRYPQDERYSLVSPSTSPPRSHLDALSEVSSISPIEPEGSFSSRLPLPSHDQRSRLPQRVASDKTKLEPNRQKSPETRWDSYSGEPTKDESGQPATVRPGTTPLEHQYPRLKERTKQILAGLREREAARNQARDTVASQIAPVHPLDIVVHKKPWNGYSGRTTLVDPVQDNPSARTESLNRPPLHVNIVEREELVMRVESPVGSLRSISSEESIKPVAPLKLGTRSRTTSPQSSNGSNSPPFFDAMHSSPPTYQPPRTLQSPFSSPGPVTGFDVPAPLIYTRTDSPPNEAVPDTPRTPPLPMTYSNFTPIKEQQMPNEPDVSRFSWTTYATTVTESPGSTARIFREESPPPPVPQIPQLSIRKRPVSDNHVGSSYTNKNALPAQSNVLVRKPVGSKPRHSSGASSQLTLSKTLPQIPSEIEATDKISSLEAQMNDLAVQKYNTTRIIRDLNDNLKKNAVTYDRWKRKHVIQRITDHEEELQTIANEEHDTGIRLHRALRKRDTENNYEKPTGLWIRRVTT